MVRTSVFHPRESETDRVLNRITCCPDCFEVCHRDEASSRLLLLGALLGAATGYHAFSPDHESTVFGRNVEGLRPDPVADEVAAKRQEREGGSEEGSEEGNEEGSREKIDDDVDDEIDDGGDAPRRARGTARTKIAKYNSEMWLRRQNQAFLRSELAAIPEGDQQSLKEERERLVEELKTADAEASGLSLPKTRKKKSEP